MVPEMHIANFECVPGWATAASLELGAAGCWLLAALTVGRSVFFMPCLVVMIILELMFVPRRSFSVRGLG